MTSRPGGYLPPLILASGEGEKHGIGQDQLVYKLKASQSGGLMSVIERSVAPKFQSPPQEHANTREDWVIYVLEGSIGLTLDGKESLLEAGGFVYAPRGTFFRWWNPDATPARILTIYTPGAFGDFFAELIQKLAPKTGQISDYARTLQEITALQDRYGMVRKP